MFGKLNYLLATVSLITPAMTVGLNSIVSRELLVRPSDTGLIMGTGLAIRSIGSIFFALLASLIAYRYLLAADFKLFVFLILCNVSNALLIVDFWFQSKVANSYGAIVKSSVAVIFTVIRLIAIKLDADISAFIYIAGLEIICISALYLLTFSHLTAGLRHLRFSWSEAKQLLRDSRWLMLSGIAAVIYLKIDQVMLGIMIDDRAVGIYAAAAKFSEVWYFISAAIVVSLFPNLVNKKRTNQIGYGSDIQKINDFLYCIGLGIAITVSVSAHLVLPLLLGDAYSESIPVLVAHVWAGVFVFMRALLSKWLITENLLKLSMMSQVLGAVFNVALNMRLIPLYGPLGAAYATVISYAVSGYLVLFFHRDLWPMAMVVTRSILLPIRFAQKGLGLYKT